MTATDHEWATDVIRTFVYERDELLRRAAVIDDAIAAMHTITAPPAAHADRERRRRQREAEDHARAAAAGRERADATDRYLDAAGVVGG